MVLRAARRVVTLGSGGDPGRPEDLNSCSAAIAIRPSTSGAGAGSPTVRVNASKPAGSATSRKRAPSGELTVKVCGMPRGPKTNDPAGASMTCPPTQKVSAPSMT
jgi:hypothetical protein